MTAAGRQRPLGVIATGASERATGLPDGADGALWVGLPAGTPVPRHPPAAAVLLTHRDDPVSAWSPALVVRPDSNWHHPCLPVLSFWLMTADVVAARTVPAGHGHRYEDELDGAGRRVLDGVSRSA